MGEEELAVVTELWGFGVRPGNLRSGVEKRREKGRHFVVTRRRSTSQGGKTSYLTWTEGEGPNLAIVCVWFLTLTNGVALKQRPGSSSYCNAVAVAAIEAITMVH
jgi:hypothetical protein